MEEEIHDLREKRSKYYKTLSGDAKTRYDNKLRLMNLEYDPYVIGKKYFNLTEKFDLWPRISFPDIYSFLIDYPSIYTHKKSGSI